MQAMREEEEAFEVPLTPLIDIVFLLLIFFLVATNFTRKEIDQQVKLPRAEGGSRQPGVPDNLVINVREDGTIVVEGSIRTMDELRLLVRAWHGQHPGRRVAIRGDGQVPYEKIMKVMGLCKLEGVTNVDLPVEEPGEQGTL